MRRRINRLVLAIGSTHVADLLALKCNTAPFVCRCADAHVDKGAFFALKVA